MKRLDALFEQLRAERRTGLIAYVTAGFPTREATVPIVQALIEGGADAIELGLPFSDPLADGATIQRATFAALEQGVTPSHVLGMVRELREGGVEAPLLVMGYMNPLHAYGLERFGADAAAAGLDGLICVDLPPEEAEPLPPANGGAPVVALDGVTFAYVPGAPVLAGATLAVHRGEVVALTGPNGSGKTTLAKIAAGLLQPDSGSVLRARRAGYLSQDPGRYVVRERADDEVALAVHGDRERTRGALDAFGLGWAAARHPRDLSSGERERLALAAVAVAEPDLLVLDEPTRGMDPERKAAVGDWIERYAAAGRGVLVVTHDSALPAHRRVELGASELALA